MTRFATGGKVISLEEAASRVPDGAHLTIGGFACAMVPMALMRELIRQGRTGFELTSMGDCWAADLLAGAACLRRVRLSNYMFEGLGRCYNFCRAVEQGTVEVDDYSHFAVTARLQAGALGLPSIPVRTMLGTDLVAVKPLDADAVKPAPCPITGEPLLYLKALRPDFALVHASRADADGNVQLLGMSSILDEQCRAAARVIVTVEEIVPNRVIRQQPELTLLPGFLVEAVVEAPFGAHPCGMFQYYTEDSDHTRRFSDASRKPDTFREYLEAYVFGLKDHWAYLDKIGIGHLLSLRADPWFGY